MLSLNMPTKTLAIVRASWLFLLILAFNDLCSSKASEILKTLHMKKKNVLLIFIIISLIKININHTYLKKNSNNSRSITQHLMNEN